MAAFPSFAARRRAPGTAAAAGGGGEGLSRERRCAGATCASRVAVGHQGARASLGPGPAGSPEEVSPADPRHARPGRLRARMGCSARGSGRPASPPRRPRPCGAPHIHPTAASRAAQSLGTRSQVMALRKCPSLLLRDKARFSLFTCVFSTNVYEHIKEQGKQRKRCQEAPKGTQGFQRQSDLLWADGSLSLHMQSVVTASPSRNPCSAAPGASGPSDPSFLQFPEHLLGPGPEIGAGFREKAMSVSWASPLRECPNCPSCGFRYQVSGGHQACGVNMTNGTPSPLEFTIWEAKQT